MSDYDELQRRVEEAVQKRIESEHSRERKLDMIQDLAEADLENAELSERRRAIIKEKKRQRNGRFIKAKRTK